MKFLSEKPIAVIGAGSFGTTLAHLWAEAGHSVILWGRDEKIVSEIQNQHTNSKYLPGIKLSIPVTNNLEEALQEAYFVVFAIPCQAIRSVLTKIDPKLLKKSILINTAKGIEQNTLKLPSQIFLDEIQNSEKRFVAFSGPTFASELARGEPTGAVVASKKQFVATEVQQTLSLPFLRLYTSDDVVGVELGGALKNVMAIATGIAEGLGFGLNSRAGLVTRCLHEMIKLGVSLEANPLTFSGLSGLGDLILTCTGALSRNRKVGIELGRGKTLDEIKKNLSSVAEGITTAQSVHELAKKQEIEMPNAEFVYRILYENLSPQEALKAILARELKNEREGL